MCELKMLTITSDNMTVYIFLQWNNKRFHKYDYLEYIYAIKSILNSSGRTGFENKNRFPGF